jgi:hypothetical protein
MHDGRSIEKDNRDSGVLMSPLFAKLNLKDCSEILVVDAPETIEAELGSLEGVTVQRDPKRARSFGFALAFASKQADVDRLSRLLAGKAKGDTPLWFAYPKGTSKKFSCDFNRDTGWRVLLAAGYETVRQVAIDEDWSALRFRRVEFINKGAGSRKAR